MAVLHTTHYMEGAERLCDRVGIIDAARIRAEGTRRELVRLVGGQEGVEGEAGGDLHAAAVAAAEVELRTPDLEHVILHLIGKALRD